MGPVLSKSELAQTEPAERAAFQASFRSSMRGIGVVFRSLLTASEIQDLRPHEVCGGEPIAMRRRGSLSLNSSAGCKIA